MTVSFLLLSPMLSLSLHQMLIKTHLLLLQLLDNFLSGLQLLVEFILLAFLLAIRVFLLRHLYCFSLYSKQTDQLINFLKTNIITD